MTGRLAPLVLVAATLLACATAGSMRQTVALRVDGNVPDATVWVDDHLVGRVSDLSKSPRRLVAGFHRIEVRAPGYYSSYHEVVVTSGTDVSIHVDLHELVQ